jgi:hypothetical protein
MQLKFQKFTKSYRKIGQKLCCCTTKRNPCSQLEQVNHIRVGLGIFCHCPDTLQTLSYPTTGYFANLTKDLMENGWKIKIMSKISWSWNLIGTYPFFGKGKSAFCLYFFAHIIDYSGWCYDEYWLINIWEKFVWKSGKDLLAKPITL